MARGFDEKRENFERFISNRIPHASSHPRRLRHRRRHRRLLLGQLRIGRHLHRRRRLAALRLRRPDPRRGRRGRRRRTTASTLRRVGSGGRRLPAATAA